MKTTFVTLLTFGALLSGCGTLGMKVEMNRNYTQKQEFDTDGFHVVIDKTTLQGVRKSDQFNVLTFDASSQEYIDLITTSMSDAGISRVKRVQSSDQWDKNATGLFVTSSYALTFGSPDKAKPPYMKSYQASGGLSYGDKNEKGTGVGLGILNALTVVATAAAGNAAAGAPTVSAATPRLADGSQARTYADMIETVPCQNFDGCTEKFEIVGCIMTEPFQRCSDQILITVSSASSTSTSGRKLMSYGVKAMVSELANAVVIKPPKTESATGTSGNKVATP
ncbi:hypothetical protein VVD49_13490 [Uliginosibacterium sp. H3]|uniref:Lipoprotein n=1 Tax=Uliginosibacterium silvisoli TaxID=3114758 RepID=A0ABU6K514_9RHOO|nr:hypothetical protein [Uliginosibacterium sp. H3]